MQTADKYESVMRDARETVSIVAARRGIDSRIIDVDIDAGLGPGPHKVHVLVIRIRGAPLSVRNASIAHDWLRAGTGFTDDRFSKLVAALLGELAEKAQKWGIELSAKS